MQSVVFEKKLNNAELGKGNVHDCYIREDSAFNFNEFKFVKSEMMSFWCPRSEKYYNGIHYEKFSNENRIAGFGDFFSDFSITAADTVIITGNISDGTREYIIDVKKAENVIVLVQSKNGFEILNTEKLSLINSNTKYKGETFSIDYIRSVKKRSDAPSTTDYYVINVNGVPFNPELGKIFEIVIEGNIISFRERKVWKKTIINTGD